MPAKRPIGAEYAFCPIFSCLIRHEHAGASDGFAVEARIALDHPRFVIFGGGSFAVGPAHAPPKIGTLGERIKGRRERGLVVPLDDEDRKSTRLNSSH